MNKLNNENTPPLELWFDKAADFFEEALPLGNGHLGMMVYGRVRDELIELNHDTLWSGCPREKDNHDAVNHLDEARSMIENQEYRKAQDLVTENMLGQFGESYMPMGNLRMQFAHSNKQQYKRSLDISNATCHVQYVSNATKFTREMFLSNVDEVGIVKLRANGKEKLEFVLSMDSKLKFVTSIENNNSCIMQGEAPEHVEPSFLGDLPNAIEYGGKDTKALKFATVTKILTDGYIANTGSGLLVKGASEALIIFSAGTTYNGFNNDNRQVDDVIESLKTKVEKAETKGYEKIKKDHIADFTEIFDRVQLEIKGIDRNDLPTDKRVENLREGNVDIGLINLFFQFGRYLLISSSRPGSQPANLQGIWNYEVRPPWSSNYTININTQMNYWLAETCNLSDCHQPMMQMIKELSVNGRKTAEIQFGCKGWMAAHNTDLWRFSTPVAGQPMYAYWPMGGAWLSTHIWQHYQFTQDIDFLKEFYPVLKEAAEFCLEWLFKDSSGFLVTSPSTTPENSFLDKDGKACSVSKASTMDMAIIRDLFTACNKAGGILNSDSEFSEKIKDAIEKLHPYKIGKHGQLQEWYDDFEEQDPGHRHISHLYSIYPGNSINNEMPDLMKACSKTLERRLKNGGGHTGWSCAWIINMWARLKDAEMAYKYLNTLFTKSTYPNLFDAHPPFQIDGNFGGAAGIAEMLIQSHEEYIEVLPALPNEWKDGSVKGLCARGGYEVDMEWSNGELDQVVVKATDEKICKIKYKDEILEILTKKR